MNKTISTLIIGGMIFSSAAQAGMIRDGVWQIEEGDQLKAILKTALPDQPLRQKRLQRLSKLLNKQAFDTKGNLVVGQTLRLPGVKMPSNEAAPVADSVGKVLITNGPAVAKNTDGKTRTLQRGSEIRQGDTIETKGARAQVRFSDGSLLALRPNTEFKVEEYSFNGKQDGSERGIYRLIKGGFRTISGVIGKTNKDNYEVRTPVATIGIRGTHYGITLCIAGSCADQGLADGLYGGVVDGAVQASNSGGTQQFGNDEYFLISDINSLAQELLAPPGVIFDDPASPPQTSENQQEEGDKKTKLERKAEAVVKAILKDKRPDFDGTLDDEQIREIIRQIREQIGEVAGTLSQPQHPTLPDDNSPTPDGTGISFSFIGETPNPLNPGVIESVSESGVHDADGPLRFTMSQLGSHSNALRGISFEKLEGNTAKIIASLIGTDVANLSDTGVSSALGFTWGRWSNTPLKGEATGGATIEKTPINGFNYVIADGSKLFTNATALNNFASSNGINSFSRFDGVNARDLSGNTPTEATGGNFAINFGTQMLSFNITEDINNTQYTLHTGTAGNQFIDYTNLVIPGNNADLRGTCSGSAGSDCQGIFNLSGEASFLFTNGVTPTAGPPAIGVGVTYAGHGTNHNGETVGISGADIFIGTGLGQ